ncbi:hypothetical protein SAMN02745164_01119 [Marinitoga hydrogenitolerans DSM 16785]|uniref:Carboxypeptidase regulatory-like domain-containing protein n=1 Tax=Marinitoga hydrogenitolerans (strain DSM 16785 / JCM 12826 / AT1271) TaxID=1122195 RepID=A0A1M4W7F5_MARH1|nr:hypothetical protein [Marinitoga hydrogenitolerans]SHE77156.1 hypothetical protein SAMN02745164_01119 [Marinitoga hydrogenitolerans DSM 16785]
MKKSFFFISIFFLAFLLYGCMNLNSEKTYYIEGYFKDDWGDGQLHPWSGKFLILALDSSNKIKGYDIANDQESTDDYFKIKNLPEGNYILKVYTDSNNNIDENNLEPLLNITPDATKHYNLTNNASITILFGEDD